ncbi:MAG: PRC-barrel domain-containing protein [Rubrobacter sp.]|nr:PRC-barrel domain-containing protein [Rubrobacter sp.]
MVHMGNEDQFVELKKSHRDYKVFGGHYERIGKVDEIFVDEADHPIYLGVSMGLLESGSVLIPMDIVRINDKRGLVEVDTSRNRIEEAPSLGAGDEISPETEDKVRIYYGLKPLHSSSQRPGDAHTQEPSADDPLAFDERIDLVPGEREAAQERFEGDPPYRERSEQLRLDQEREAAQREAMEREAAEREAAEGSANPRDSAEEPRDETGNRGGSTGARVRRLSR